MWSDNETEVDLLDFGHLVAAVESIIQDQNLLPATVGVFGDWGSGKSSLMRMVQASFENDEANKDGNLFCISFNGWLFEGYEDAKTALMSTILKEVANRRPLGTKAKEKLEKLLRRVNWMRIATITASAAGRYGLAYAAGGRAGLAAAVLCDTTGVVGRLTGKPEELEEELGQLVKELPESEEDVHLSMREFHRDFEEFLQEAKIETLVVFIDDLDRCTPDTVIGTLEAIRLFLFAPQTVFVVGADERLVRDAVRQRFPEFQAGQGEVGRDYLEKLVQFPVRIPPLGRAELETYINLLFAERAGLDDSQLKQLREAAANRSPDRLYDVAFSSEVVQEVLGEVSPEIRESMALAGYLAPVLTAGLSGNPRQTKRFLNTLMMRRRMAQSRRVDLELRVLAKLMLLEYFKPERFNTLAQWQAEQMGRPHELARLEQYVRQPLPNDQEDETTPSESKDASLQSSGGNGVEAGVETDRDKEDTGIGRREGDVDDLNESLRKWLSEAWIQDWLVSDPPLSSYDLRPYFFFSRDRLGILSAPARRLSPAAQEVLIRITSESDVERREAARLAEPLSDAEAASVFRALAQQARQEEDLSGDRSVLDSLVRLVETRREISGELMVLLESLAEKALGPGVVPDVIRLARGSEVEQSALALVERWSRSSTNPALAVAAAEQLKRYASKTNNSGM